MHTMNEHIYIYIKKAPILFTVEVAMAEKRTPTCIYHSNLERTPLTHESHIALNVYSLLTRYMYISGDKHMKN